MPRPERVTEHIVRPDILTFFIMSSFHYLTLATSTGKKSMKIRLSFDHVKRLMQFQTARINVIYNDLPSVIGFRALRVS